jgi:hypothetical protein
VPSKQFWSVVVTAAFAIAITFTPLPESWRLPVVIGAWIITAFAGGAWLNEHRKTSVLSALKKRNCLDNLMSRGNALYDQWLVGRRPRLRTKLWHYTVKSFVSRNFSMTLNDQFKQYSSPEPATIYKIELAKLKEQLPPTIAESALKISAYLAGLKWIRREIRD